MLVVTVMGEGLRDDTPLLGELPPPSLFPPDPAYVSHAWTAMVVTVVGFDDPVTQQHFDSLLDHHIISGLQFADKLVASK